jgi:hypothetical protein
LNERLASQLDCGLLDRPVNPRIKSGEGDDSLEIADTFSVTPRPRQRNSLQQGIWQGNFSESHVTATIPAGLAQLSQRVAPNSLRLRGREFVAPAQGKFRGWQGIHKVGQGIGDSAVTRPPMSPVGLPSIDLSLTGRNLMAK